MAYEQKPNTGVLFQNSRKQQPNHPDYTGTFKDVNGKTWDVAAWTKTDKNGKEFFSFTVKEPRQQ